MQLRIVTTSRNSSTRASSHKERSRKPGTTCTPSITMGSRSAIARRYERFHAHDHVLGLFDETHGAEVRRARQRHAHGRRGVERRRVHGGHEIDREEGAHDLAHHVGADHAVDAQPMRQLRRQGALPRRGAADEDDRRRLQAAQELPLGEAPDEQLAVGLPELLARDGAQVAERERHRVAAPQAPLHRGGHGVGALRREARGHQGLRHQALAERQPVALVDERRVVAGLSRSGRHRPASA